MDKKINPEVKFHISFINKFSPIYTHTIAWVLYWAIDYGFVYTIRGGKANFFEYLSNVFFNLIYFYTLIYFLQKPKISISILKSTFTVIVILFFSILLKNIFDIQIIHNPAAIDTLQKNPFSYYSFELWRLSTMSFYGFAFLIFRKSINDQKTILQTEKKLLLTEIAFLKAQINPHFLFNTLNFVFEDVSQISPKSGDVILKLADMMRYSVQSTKLDFAPIIKEVEAIDRYIYLQRKRFGEKMYVEFYKIGNLNGAEIPPLIMLSLVENAFKYGVIYNEECPIEIYLEVTDEAIIFSCRNEIRTQYREVETNAVGITNIKRRLEISYSNKFELDNWVENKNYFVHLKIFLK